ncbi:MAG: hypothetical protein ACYSUX_02275 [Planctomycetota bacterium]|jgi:hypothetical protein
MSVVGKCRFRWRLGLFRRCILRILLSGVKIIKQDTASVRTNMKTERVFFVATGDFARLLFDNFAGAGDKI